MTDPNTISETGRHIDLLRGKNLRPTRQRVALADLLFNNPCRHVSAEQLRAETQHLGISMSLATIYNTLNQFTRVGLLHEINLDNNVTYFDTNTDHHFFTEGVCGADMPWSGKDRTLRIRMGHTEPHRYRSTPDYKST